MQPSDAKRYRLISEIMRRTIENTLEPMTWLTPRKIKTMNEMVNEGLLEIESPPKVTEEGDDWFSKIRNRAPTNGRKSKPKRAKPPPKRVRR